jgi:hypothetical protein
VLTGRVDAVGPAITLRGSPEASPYVLAVQGSARDLPVEVGAQVTVCYRARGPAAGRVEVIDGRGRWTLRQTWGAASKRAAALAGVPTLLAFLGLVAAEISAPPWVYVAAFLGLFLALMFALRPRVQVDAASFERLERAGALLERIETVAAQRASALAAVARRRALARELAGLGGGGAEGATSARARDAVLSLAAHDERIAAACDALLGPLERELTAGALLDRLPGEVASEVSDKLAQLAQLEEQARVNEDRVRADREVSELLGPAT